jgi:hypothetical protein
MNLAQMIGLEDLSQLGLRTGIGGLGSLIISLRLIISPAMKFFMLAALTSVSASSKIMF